MIYFNSKLYKYSIFNNYWTRLRKISWSGRHWQITIFCDNHSSIIVLSFDHRVWFLMNVLKEAKQSAIFTEKSDPQEGEKRGFVQNIFSAKHSWTTLRMSRPLFACHVGGSRPMKRKKICLEWIKMLFVTNALVYCFFYKFWLTV